MKAKAAVFYGKNDIRVEEKDIRPPKENEVVVKVAYCGICGTDIHIYNGDEGSVEVVPPVVLGHEASGVVYQTGSAFTSLAIGDHVAIDPNLYCGECHYCRSGLEHYCFYMHNPEGGFAKYCTVPAKAVLKIPKSLPLDEAAFAEPLACCLHGIDRTNIRLGDQVLIIGGGTIGLLMLQLAKLSGASRLSIIEPDQNKRLLAEKFGADLIFANSGAYLDFANKTPGFRADRVIECVGLSETVSLAIQSASKGGTVMIFGLTPPKAKVEVYPFEIFKKELTITSSFVNPLTQSRAVELLASGKVCVSDLISGRIPLEKLSEALSEPEYRTKTKILVELI